MISKEQAQSILEYYDLYPQYFTWQIKNKDSLSEFITKYIKENFNDINIKTLILMLYLENVTYKEALETIEDELYLVYTDTEADEAAYIEAEYYVEEIVLPEIPERYTSYFDTDKFIEDYLSYGRGNVLASYDGVENTYTYNDEEYYIYKK